jgi:hypothetical protein
VSPAATDSRFHCGSDTILAGVKFRECVIVAPSSSGAFVQSLLSVTNTSSGARTVHGTTEALLGQTRLSYTACGSRVLAAGAGTWCFSATKPVPGHGRDVWAEGHLDTAQNPGSTRAVSPIVKS